MTITTITNTHHLNPIVLRGLCLQSAAASGCIVDQRPLPASELQLEL